MNISVGEKLGLPERQPDIKSEARELVPTSADKVEDILRKGVAEPVFDLLMKGIEQEKLTQLLNESVAENITQLLNGKEEKFIQKFIYLVYKVTNLEWMTYLINNTNPYSLSALIEQSGTNFATLINRMDTPRSVGAVKIPPQRMCELINDKSIDIGKLAYYIMDHCFSLDPLTQMLSGELKKKPFLRSEREFTIQEIIQELHLA